MYHFLALVCFVFGLIVGSFLNVVIHRIPRGMSIVSPPSTCPKSGRRIPWYDNIPLLSWLALGGMGRYSKAPIGWQYPLVEGLTGTLFVLTFLQFGFTLATPVYMLFCAAMVVVTFVDLTDWTIPDEVTLPGIPIGITAAIIGMFLPQTGLQVPGLNEDVFDSLLGVVLGGGSLWLLDKISIALLNKPGMGFGDVKLNAMLGAFLGWKGVIVVIIVASLIGSVVGISMILAQRLRGEEDSAAHYLPFGPYLALAGLVTLFIGSAVIEFYLGLMELPPVEPATGAPVL